MSASQFDQAEDVKLLRVYDPVLKHLQEDIKAGDIADLVNMSNYNQAYVKTIAYK